LKTKVLNKTQKIQYRDDKIFKIEKKKIGLLTISSCDHIQLHYSYG